MTAARRLHAAATAGDRLRGAYARRPVRGTFLIELPTARTVRALALAGFDFVVLDLEHSPFGVGALAGLVAEAHAVDLPVLVRVSRREGALIGKVLDLGVCGVMIPHVGSAEEAAEAVRFARYPPAGVRSVSPLIGHVASWSVGVSARDSVLVVVQIEGLQAVDRAAEIATVVGVDGVFVGAYDLAQSLGTGENVEADAVVAAAEHVAAECSEHVMLGIYVDVPARSESWAERGFRLQCVSFDGRMLLQGARAVLHEADGAGDPFGPAGGGT